MPSIVEDFSFIAKRVHEIRAARYHELGVSPPVSSEQSQPSVRQEPLAPTNCDGFRYAPGFEPATSPPVDDWDRCFPPT
jgi:hypothetical protein